MSKQSNSTSKTGFNVTRHEQKKPKLTWIDIKRISNAIKSK